MGLKTGDTVLVHSFLSSIGYVDVGVWKISAFYSDSKDSGFTYAEDILLLDDACPIALGSPEGSDVYLYVSRDDGIYWRADSRKLSTDN